jgi:type IV secretory pathway VirB2 component (pilin)
MKESLTGFRKFAMAVIFLVVAICLLLFDVVPKDDWMKHVASVMIAFMATNVGEHIINVGKEWIKKKSS